ncbi:MAG: hypothetical protein AAFQ14_09835 [Cyanobacteria bacterium J06621_12]
MACKDLCTAARCDDLERQIDRLKTQVEQLVIELQGHINQPVPYSHNYTPNYDLRTRLVGNEIITEFRLENDDRQSKVTLPDTVVPTVTVDIVPIDSYQNEIKVTVNEISDTAILATEPEQLDFVVTEINPGQFDFEITLGEQLKTQTLNVTVADDEQPAPTNIDFAVDVSYLFNLLKVAVTIDGITKSDTVYIDANVINNFGGGGSGINIGDNDVECKNLAAAMTLNLGEVLAAIAAVQAKVTQIEKIVTIEVEAEALTGFDCPKTDPDSGEESDSAKTEEIKLATLPAIHEMLRHLNENQVSMFEKICEGGGALALPAWWQTRLNASVPQLACVFRKGGSSTYHTINIPHPASTKKPTKPVLPPYTKGNYMGMVTCRDNSKFIINCETEAEAEQMCQVAIGLIGSDWLESPPRVYTGKRKGQAVGVAPMLPTSIEYFESGQQNTIPNWRVRVTGTEF